MNPFSRVLAASTVTLAFLACAPTAQAVNSVSLTTPATAKAGSVVPVKTTGNTDGSAFVYTYAEPNAMDCATTQAAQAARPNVVLVLERLPDPGLWVYDATFVASKMGTYRICSYVYLFADDRAVMAPRASASQTISVTVTDSDGDGIFDHLDKCPSVTGVSPDGCPPPAAPVTPMVPVTPVVPVVPTPVVVPAKKCVVPSLKGKTLAAAKKALKKANCKLGKVTKPKKVKKGARLVVSKQSGKGPVNVTLKVKKTKKK